MNLKLFSYKKVKSTNSTAINLIKQKKFKKGIVHSISQTNGRGRYGNKWISDKGNLFVSLFFQLKEKYPSFNEFAIINPVIIFDVIKKFCDSKKLSIKYPNDIFYNRKKICGLLQELITIKNRKFLVIGIGINIISNPDIKNTYKATNIFSETSKKPSILEIINLIIASYSSFLSNLDIYNYGEFKKKADLLSIKWNI